MANIPFENLPQQIGLSGDEVIALAVPDGNGGYTSKQITSGSLGSFILPASGVQPGTYGDATHVGQVTIDEQGIVTTATNVEIETGAGSVTSVSVETANGLAGTVANPTTDAAITLSTTVTGLLKGNGTAISAATPDTDYQSPISLTTTGTSGAATFSGDVLNIPVYPSGSVTSLSVVSANGLGGSVANPTTTPAITLSTSITGILEGDGTAISAASTTGSGVVVLATNPAITGASLGSSTATTQVVGDNSTKLATTAYVQAAISGTTTLAASDYATTTALPTVTYNNGSSGVGATLTAVAVGALSIDGASPTVGQIILVKNQASSFQNGIYSVTVAGSGAVAFVLTRATYYDESGQIDLGDTTFVESGATLAATSWTQNGTENPAIGTDPITWAQTAGPGSFVAANGIAISGNQIAIDTSVTVDKTSAQTLENKTLVTPDLGTPSALNLENATNLLPLLTATLAALPTSLPGSPGVVWNNGGVVSIS